MKEPVNEPLIYVACPYSDNQKDVMAKRFESVSAFCAELLRYRVMVFSPISHSHPIAQYGLPKGWDFWQRWGRIYLEFCDAIIVLRLPGWDVSIGVTAEIAAMKAQGKPIVYAEYAIDAAILAAHAVHSHFPYRASASPGDP